jgi:hypothetical protein
MAYTNPTPSWASNEKPVGSAKLNQVGANIDELKLGLNTDGSAASAAFHGHMQGTLAARATVAHLAGRMYYATDIDTLFMSNGTAWKHIAGEGVYDSFERANNSNLNLAPGCDSGHSWTERIGDTQIATNGVTAVTLSGGEAFAVVDTGAEIKSGTFFMGFFIGAVPASTNIGLCTKYLNTTTKQYIQLTGTPSLLIKNHTTTLSTNTVPALTANGFYALKVLYHGSVMFIELYNNIGMIFVKSFGHPTTIRDYAAGATEMGLMLGSTQDRVDSISWTPN